ncbi:MAG: hypothetical protein LC640_09450 [Frankia sp.]|nr:hypothetical protein [Frankia sp.]
MSLVYDVGDLVDVMHQRSGAMARGELDPTVGLQRSLLDCAVVFGPDVGARLLGHAGDACEWAGRLPEPRRCVTHDVVLLDPLGGAP